MTKQFCNDVVRHFTEIQDSSNGVITAVYEFCEGVHIVFDTIVPGCYFSKIIDFAKSKDLSVFVSLNVDCKLYCCIHD